MTYQLVLNLTLDLLDKTMAFICNYNKMSLKKTIPIFLFENTIFQTQPQICFHFHISYFSNDLLASCINIVDKLSKVHCKLIKSERPYIIQKKQLIIKLSSMIFILILQYQPIRTLYLLETAFWLANFRAWIRKSYLNIIWT